MLREAPIAAGPTSAWDAALAWLDTLIEREVLRLRARYELSLDELGVCIFPTAKLTNCCANAWVMRNVPIRPRR